MTDQQHDTFDPTTDDFMPEFLGGWLLRNDGTGNRWGLAPERGPHIHAGFNEYRQTDGGCSVGLFSGGGHVGEEYQYNGAPLAHAVVIDILRANGYPVPADQRGLTNIVREQCEEIERLRDACRSLLTYVNDQLGECDSPGTRQTYFGLRDQLREALGLIG